MSTYTENLTSPVRPDVCVFFEHEARAAERALNTRPMNAVAATHSRVVVRGELVARRIARLRDDLLEQRYIHRREVAATARPRRDGVRFAFELHPTLQRSTRHAELRSDRVIGLVTCFVRGDDSLAQFDRQRTRHGDL